MVNCNFSVLKKSIALSTMLFASSLSFADSSYSVQKGDTLYSISRKYQITVAELRAANNLSESDILKAGQKLVIPSANISNAAALSSSKRMSSDKSYDKLSSQIYVVQKGDTLYGIARKYSMKLPELLSVNSLDSNATIKVGQKLKVFVSQPAIASATKNDESKKVVLPEKTETPSVKTTIIEKNNVASNEYKTKGIVWPLQNPTVKKIKGKVSGVELTGVDNESVRVVHEGTVMYTGLYRGFGEIVFVQSKTGLIYSYSGLSVVSVKKGDYVLSGDSLGTTGKKPESTIKFMVFQNGNPIDPMKAPRG